MICAVISLSVRAADRLMLRFHFWNNWLKLFREVAAAREMPRASRVEETANMSNGHSQECTARSTVAYSLASRLRTTVHEVAVGAMGTR